jgi:hypothetical protein
MATTTGRSVTAALGEGSDISEEQIDGALEDAVMAEMVPRVASIVEVLPEPYHTGTSNPVSPVHLAMVLVRLNDVDNYEELLEHIRWMG